MSKEIETDNIIPVKEINPLRKNISGLIDAGIVITLFVGIYSSLPVNTLINLKWSVPAEFYILVSLVIYRLISLLVFNRTVGMRVCSIQILNDDLEILSFKEKTFASFFILINSINYYRSARKKSEL
jgi:uncharacterized RDD family membrane protein YckC